MGGPGRGWASFSREESPQERCWEGVEEGGRGFRSAPTEVALTFGQSAPAASSWRPQGPLQLSLCLSADHLDAVPSLQQNRGDSGPLTFLQPWARRRRTDRAPGGQARKMDRPLARDAAGGQAGRQATSSGTNGHRGGQARPPRCPPSPRSAPAPAAHPPGLEHRFISKCRHNPTIGFLITGSNVRRINILTN